MIKRSYFQIDKQIFRKTQFNGTVAVFDNGKVKMNKGYGYQDIEKGKRNCKYNVFNRISAKIYNRFNAEAT